MNVNGYVFLAIMTIASVAYMVWREPKQCIRLGGFLIRMAYACNIRLCARAVALNASRAAYRSAWANHFAGAEQTRLDADELSEMEVA